MRMIGCLLFSMVFSLFAQQPADITADGFGEAATKEEALLAAKRNAVEKGIGTILLSQTEIENFMLKKDQIITKTVGAVKSYETLSEAKSPEGNFQIKIKAVLARATIKEDLAAAHILIESMNKPRVLVIVKESNIGNEEPTNAATENGIISFLRDPYEFDLIDPSVVQSIKASQSKMAELAGDPSMAAKLGSGYGAEVIITGSGVARQAELNQSLGGMVSVQADVTLRAINCSSGRIIATADAHGAQVHISPNTAGTKALDKASRIAAGKLLDAIMKEWNNQINNGITLSVTIQGVTSFRDKKTVLATLSSLANVSAVRERSWDGQSKVLEADIVYKGNANGFADKVDGFKLKTGSGSLAVQGQEGSRITLVNQVM